MKKFFAAIILVAVCSNAYSWGKNGHRIVGAIAESYLTPKAKKKIQELLGNEQLAMVGNHMDFIRSDNQYRHMSPWHYCTIPDDKTYQEVGTPEKGDIIVTINRLMIELGNKKFTDKDEVFALKMLVHLIGDIHQPLHVGNGEDKGGNDVKVEFFWEQSNLHRVWDEGIIEEQKLSYTEYVKWINHTTEDQLTNWQSAGVMDWVAESKSYRSQVYNLPESKKINYRYVYDNIELLNLRLLQAGVRLAGVLNELYG
ncbi:MAG: S1/P1 nuclease [Cyclobacteriaceae bacterium]